MRNSNFVLLAVALLFMVLQSCEVVKPPYKEVADKLPEPTTDTVRNVLLEDFTGFLCGYCPPAGEEAKRLADLYGSRIKIVKLHVGELATPTTNHTADYRSATGNEIDSYYGISQMGTPQGVINRMTWGGIVVQKATKWANYVDSALALPVQALLKVNNTYVEATRTITTEVVVDYIENGTTNDYLAVYVLEDGIVGFQKWYNHDPEEIDDFTHDHTLRASMNGAWGEQLQTTAPQKGNKITKTFTYVVPANQVATNLKIMAVLHHNDTKEVIQVQDKDID